MKLCLPGQHEKDLALTVPRGYRTTVRWRPQIGDIVPDFRAEAPSGPFRFHRFAEGHWVVLFSHPAAFTAVCTSELASLAAHHHEFQARDVKLLNVSADAPAESARWLADLEDLFGVEIRFPTVTDASGTLTRLFGMVHRKEAEACAIRKTFVIDPALRIRAITEYPVAVGRSTDELLRLVDALRVSDSHDVGAPADWRPGDHCVLMPEGLGARGADFPDGAVQQHRPYLSLVELPSETAPLTRAGIADRRRRSA